jgi:hypothetical protein
MTGGEKPQRQGVAARNGSDPGVVVALDWAEIAAMLGDYAEAVAWLDYVQRVDGRLPSAFVERERIWRSKAAAR